jgi:non-ribosomal peptide synthetase component F
MLHHPFIEWVDLLTIDGQVYSSYIEAFQACDRSHSHQPDFYTDPAPEYSDSEEDSDIEEESEPEYPLDDFELLARRRPQEDFTRIPNGLNERDLDRRYNWAVHIGQYSGINAEIWDQVSPNISLYIS